jgi:hypothetical protein
METKLYQKLPETDSLLEDQLGLLSQIVIGGFPLDIGTSIAFESIFKAHFEPYDPERKIPNAIDLKEYNTILINLRTLFRNVFGSLKPDEARIATATQFTALLRFEMAVIRSLLGNDGLDIVKPYFYYSNYDNVYKAKLPEEIRIRKPDTEKQKLYDKLLADTMKKLLFECVDELDVRSFKNTVDVAIGKNALIMTHIPYDLFVYTKYRKLDLLESYTGVLKPRYLWPSKYYHGKDYTNIPLNSKLIKILGDNEMFHPSPIKYRKTILSFGEQHNWTPLTTPEKVIFDIRNWLDDKELKELILKI